MSQNPVNTSDTQDNGLSIIPMPCNSATKDRMPNMKKRYWGGGSYFVCVTRAQHLIWKFLWQEEDYSYSSYTYVNRNSANDFYCSALVSLFYSYSDSKVYFKKCWKNISKKTVTYSLKFQFYILYIFYIKLFLNTVNTEFSFSIQFIWSMVRCVVQYSSLPLLTLGMSVLSV